jgi:1-acyl-sn-glycerol-3-phosphate acyltransferase
LAKYVLIAAPHTSNWDFLVLLMMDFSFKLASVWMGKASLFRGPLAPFFRRVGGIPIDRTRRTSVVDQAIEAFDDSERMVLVIAPEGTRSKSRHWKTGFYHIAVGAKVPLVFGFLDYRRKVTGIGTTLMPCGDIETDMAAIRGFYHQIAAKYPEEYGAIEVATRRA